MLQRLDPFGNHFAETLERTVLRVDHHIADGDPDDAGVVGPRIECGVDVDLFRQIVLPDEINDAGQEFAAGAILPGRADGHADRQFFGFLATDDRNLRIQNLAAVLIVRMEKIMRLVRTRMAAERFLVTGADQIVVLRLLELARLVDGIESGGPRLAEILMLVDRLAAAGDASAGA